MSRLQVWQSRQSRIDYNCPWFQVVLEEVTLPNGQCYEYTLLRRHQHGVAIVALDEERRLLLQREYRHAVRSVIWQLPGGLIDSAEDPEEAARRELAEETGYSARRWRRLGVILDDPAFQDMEIHIYLAQGIEQTGPAHTDDAEWVDNSWHSIDWLRQQVSTGEIRERVLLAALAFLWAEGTI
ncbi:MAG: NUDIX hydrolase [Caldilineae bacterium]|nr:MAG: NUDIX hydrolase [Caldilineae bacterium]